jgi:hypothetical protein
MVGTLTIWGEFSPFALSLALVLVLTVLAKKKWLTDFGPVEEWTLLLPLTIFTFGYNLLWSEERYFFFIHLLFFALFLLLAKVIPDNWLERRVRSALFLIMFISFCFFPVQKLIHYRGIGKSVHEQSTRLKTVIDLHGRRLAANKNWQEGLFLAFNWRSPYYGMCAPEQDSTEILTSLRQKEIEFFFFWGTNFDERFRWLQDYPEVSLGVTPGLKIFDIRKVGQVQ